MISEKNDPDFSEKKPFGLKAENIKFNITHNPSSANPGEILRIKIPKLDENYLILPGSIYLFFELEISGHANNVFVNNLNRALIKNLKITYGGEVIQDIQRYDLFKLYEDIFLPSEKRINSKNFGISNLNIRKYRVNSGDKLTTGKDFDTEEVLLSNVFKNKYKIKLESEILNDHGVFYPFALSNSFLFELKIADVDDIIYYTDKTKVPMFKLTNIELEYNCIISQELAQKTESNYKIGKSFYYENIILEKVFSIDKNNDTIFNIQISLPRKSLKGILMLFFGDYTPGLRDCEIFEDPGFYELKPP